MRGKISIFIFLLFFLGLLSIMINYEPVQVDAVSYYYPNYTGSPTLVYLDNISKDEQLPENSDNYTFYYPRQENFDQIDFDSFSNFEFSRFQDREIVVDKKGAINQELLPGLFLETKYNEEQDDYEININTDINSDIKFNYNIGDNTLINANYILLNDNLLNNEEFMTLIKEKNIEELVDFIQSQKKQGQLGLVYQTSENLVFSADYIDNSLFSKKDDYITKFGLEYGDELTQFRAQYKYDKSQDLNEKITGVELDLRDLARISASYEIFVPEIVKSKWDFDLDFNFSDLSSLSIGYEVIDENKENNASSEKKDKKSNIEANLEIKF